MIKIIILIELIAMIISLTTGFVFLIKDKGSPQKRALYSNGVRVSLALLIIATIGWGFYSGQLTTSAPWASIH